MTINRRELILSGIVGLIFKSSLVAEAKTLQPEPEYPNLQNADIYDLQGRNVGDLVNHLAKQFQRGKKLALVSFGASWCPPCFAQIDTIDWFGRLYDKWVYTCGINCFEKGHLQEEIVATKGELDKHSKQNAEVAASKALKDWDGNTPKQDPKKYMPKYPFYLMEGGNALLEYRAAYGPKRHFNLPFNLLIDPSMRIVKPFGTLIYGSRSKDGARVDCMFYTLNKLLHLEHERPYTTDFLKRILDLEECKDL